MTNPSQKKIAETLDGMIVVDAGPGTGKTFTLVERYLNILKLPDITPDKDIMFLTFTRNAAQEIKDRLSERIDSLDEKELLLVCNGVSKNTILKTLKVSTFDSLCFSILSENPEAVSSFFGIKDVLKRSVKLIENETLNELYFTDFAKRFASKYKDKYQDEVRILKDNEYDAYKLISKMLCRGILPLKEGWFGDDVSKMLVGTFDPSDVQEWDTKTMSAINKILKESGSTITADKDNISTLLEEAILDDRSRFHAFIHDLYYEYIIKCIQDNIVTFSLAASFAFIILYNDPSVREHTACKYLMIDEFQDTNRSQLMCSQMLMSQPNLCAVGDWKQSIYGFRYAEVENITEFDTRVNESFSFINKDEKRIPFTLPKSKKLELDRNYRSSQKIIDMCFKAMGDEPNLVTLSAERKDINEDTNVVYVSADSKEEEILEVIRRIEDYVTNEKYVIHDRKTLSARKVEYGDIAVLCRTSSICMQVQKAAEEYGIPSYLQGDMSVMKTREGKLLLAWLKFIKNDGDLEGIVPILTDAGIPPGQIMRLSECVASNEENCLPQKMYDVREELKQLKSSLTELSIHIFELYGLDNDVTASILSTVSSYQETNKMHLSDLITVLETDVKRNRYYSVDVPINKKAVVIQTIHKAKGMEYPIVIIPRIDTSSFPSSDRDDSIYRFNDRLGLRCMKTVMRSNDVVKIIASWKTYLLNVQNKADGHPEEKRLFFVALSRAEQYLTLIFKEKGSKLVKPLYDSSEKCLSDVNVIKTKTSNALIKTPLLEACDASFKKIGVHGILTFDFEESVSSGKGAKYGTMIHEIANDLAEGMSSNESSKAVDEIKKILKSLENAELFPEIECVLPVPELNITLNGIIDLLAVFDDHVEIHDYKTDKTKRFHEQYVTQLSVYAHAASGHYNLPVECVLDYVTLKEQIRFSPRTMEEIISLASHALDSKNSSAIESS